jgi:hypothetical protein
MSASTSTISLLQKIGLRKKPGERLRKTKPSLSLSKGSPKQTSKAFSLGKFEGSSKIIKATAVLLLVVLVIAFFRGLFLYRSLNLPGNDHYQINEVQWTAKHDMNLLLLGFDSKQPGLHYVDYISILHYNAREKKLTILPVNVDLHYRYKTGEDAFTTQTYRRLFNDIYLQQKLASANADAQELWYKTMDEFTFALGNDLGIQFERIITADSSLYSDFFPGMGNLNFNSAGQNAKLEDEKQQLHFLFATENDKLNLRKQGDYLKAFILKGSSFLGTTYLFLSSAVVSNLLDNHYTYQQFSTNLTKDELFSVYSTLSKLNEYDITVLTIGEVSEQILIDNQAYLDRAKIDEKLSKIFPDPEILIEQARIDVINGSAKTGLATKTKRFLVNNGVNVVRTANSIENYGKNTLYVTNPQEYPKTIEFLQLTYPDLVILTEMYKDRPTGELVLVVI